MIKDQQIKDLVKATIESHCSTFISRKEAWANLYKRYEGSIRAGSITSKTSSKFSLGGAFALVENSIPRLLSQQPRYKYLGRGQDDQDVEKYDEFSQYQWDEADAQDVLKDVVKWGLITGLAGWKMGWKTEVKLRKKKGKMLAGIKISNPIALKAMDKLGVGKQVKIDDTETIKNYTVQAIKPHDLVWNVEAQDRKDIRVIGHRAQKQIKELKILGYDTTGLLSGIRGTDYWQEKMNAEKTSQSDEKKELDDMEATIYEMYSRTLNESGWYEYHITTYAGVGDTEKPNLFCIGFKINPFDEQFIPMGVYRPIKRPGKMYGFGVVEQATGVLDAEEDSLNMAVQALWLDVSRPTEYNPQNLIRPEAIDYKPGALVPVRRLGESMNVLPTPVPNIRSVSEMSQLLTKAKQNLTGITDFQTGVDQTRGAKTLGEIEIKTEESNARMKMMLDSLEKEVLQPMGKYALYMNKQFLADDKKLVYKVLGRKGNLQEGSIKFKDIEVVKDVIIIGGSSAMVMQQSELRLWATVLDKANEEVQLGEMGVPINREEIWKNIFERGLLEKDVENYLPSLKEREEGEVNSDQAQMTDAKAENANPSTARVLPTDNPEVHIPLHKAEIEARQRELMQAEQQGTEVDPVKVDEMQMLVTHLNDHTRQAGGAVPQFSAENEGAGEPDNQPIQPNEQNTGAPR